MKMRKTVVLLVLGILGLLLLSACSKKEEPAAAKPEATTAAAPATPIDPATAATITGSVKYSGAAPKPVSYFRNRDNSFAISFYWFAKHRLYVNVIYKALS